MARLSSGFTIESWSSSAKGGVDPAPDHCLGHRMITKAWALIKDTVSGFIEHEDLTRGAAIAYYTIFSIAPLLIIVIAIAGLVFGHDAAEGAIVGQLGGLIGKQSAESLQCMIHSARHQAA